MVYGVGGVADWALWWEGLFYVGSEVCQSCSVDPQAGQHHLLPSNFPVGCVPHFDVGPDFVRQLQVGPLTLPQEMDFCFYKRHKTPEICPDYAKVQIVS